ncbi:hypothetical protein SRABI121_02830 [Microbacterium sp. Bi121]|nr:hypothetical protein SRABI121_02830 [Microbacterium sp. Bi121]
MTTQRVSTTETAQTRVPPTDFTGVFGTVVGCSARTARTRRMILSRFGTIPPSVRRRIARLRRVRVVRPDLPPAFLAIPRCDRRRVRG